MMSNKKIDYTDVTPTLLSEEEKHVKDGKNTIVRGYKYMESFSRIPNFY